MTLFPSFALAYAGEAVFDIFLHSEMREKREILKNVSDFSALDGEIRLSPVIEKDAVADHDLSRVRRRQARDAVEQRRLTCARWAEDDGDSRGEGKSDVERKITSGVGKASTDLDG